MSTPSNGLPSQVPTPTRESAPSQSHHNGNQAHQPTHGASPSVPQTPAAPTPPWTPPPAYRTPAPPLAQGGPEAPSLANWGAGVPLPRTRGGVWRSLRPGESMTVAVTQVPYGRLTHKEPGTNRTRTCLEPYGESCRHCAAGVPRETRYLTEVVELGDPSSRRVWDATAAGAAALQQAAAGTPLSVGVYRIALAKSYTVSVSGIITPELAATIGRLAANDLVALARSQGDRGMGGAPAQLAVPHGWTPPAQAAPSPVAPAPAWASPPWASPVAVPVGPSLPSSPSVAAPSAASVPAPASPLEGVDPENPFGF